MADISGNIEVATGGTTVTVGEAVGVLPCQWYVAIVRNNTEKQCACKLQKMGYECYVPTQTETHQWRNGTRNVVERIVLPSMVFVHITEQQRRTLVVGMPFVKRFLTDRGRKADRYGKHPVAVIPDEQIRRFMFILENSDSPVVFETAHIRLGDRVRIVRGGLMGMEGNVVRDEDNTTYFTINIAILGVAKVMVKREDLEILDNRTITI